MKQATITWIALIACTLLTAALGHLFVSFMVILASALVLVIVKNSLIVDVFMGLKQAPTFWRIAMHVYTLFVVGLIGLSYYFSVSAA